MNWKNLFFTYFLNMDFSLIMTLTRMKICIHSAEICFEEACLNILIQGLVFVLWYVEYGTLKKNAKKSQKLPVFCHKTKTRA